MNKKTIRQKYKNKRQELTSSQIEQMSMDIAHMSLKLPIWDKKYFHVFLSIVEKKEINTQYILDYLILKNKNIVVSKSNFDTRLMQHYLFTNQTKIQRNSYNIPEPVDGINVTPDEIEVVFVPLLAFDKNGNRVGYGKGFYDLFLHNCKPTTIKIGLSFFEPEKIITDVSDTDVKLNYCITPKCVYEF